MTQRYGEEGLFARWRDRLSQALLREPTVILFERDAADMYEDTASMPAGRSSHGDRLSYSPDAML